MVGVASSTRGRQRSTELGATLALASDTDESMEGNMAQDTVKLTDPFAVRINPEDLAWLRDERDTSGASVNGMIVKAISQYVKQRKGVRARSAK